MFQPVITSILFTCIIPLSTEEDFNSTSIPFTIPGNELEPDRSITIFINDDDMVEANYEGFRLVLEVDETKGTRLSEVKFGIRQMAVFRIDNFNDSKS